MIYGERMKDAEFAEISAFVTQSGLSGLDPNAMLMGFCERLCAAGLPLARASVIIDTLHPGYEGHVFHWRSGEGLRTPQSYGRTTQASGEASESWRRSPFYRMMQEGRTTARWPLAAVSGDEHPILSELREAGITEYVTMISPFGEDRIIGEMDCAYTGWSTDHPAGFHDQHLAVLERLVPVLALAVMTNSLAGIARTLVETYLGRDAGQKVLKGRIERGVAERIEAALWFSDLRDYTRITDTAPAHQIIPLLNDYAEAIISAIQAEGGDVLKLIGDGTLAIFTSEDREHTCRAALAASDRARAAVNTLNERRSAEELPTTGMYLGLHVGEVFFGNIGSKDRLDFTVVGPAVNEVSRIAAMCRSVDQPMLVSSAFKAALGQDRRRLVSVGRFALRGVGQAQDLYTLEPQALSISS
jgi:adenylate cyclase